MPALSNLTPVLHLLESWLLSFAKRAKSRIKMFSRKDIGFIRCEGHLFSNYSLWIQLAHTCSVLLTWYGCQLGTKVALDSFIQFFLKWLLYTNTWHVSVFKFLLEYSCFNVVLISTVQQSESLIHIHIYPFFRFPSYLGHHRTMTRWLERC